MGTLWLNLLCEVSTVRVRAPPQTTPRLLFIPVPTTNQEINMNGCTLWQCREQHVAAGEEELFWNRQKKNLFYFTENQVQVVWFTSDMMDIYRIYINLYILIRFICFSFNLASRSLCNSSTTGKCSSLCVAGDQHRLLMFVVILIIWDCLFLSFYRNKYSMDFSTVYSITGLPKPLHCVVLCC